jgi:hypothetical protein
MRPPSARTGRCAVEAAHVCASRQCDRPPYHYLAYARAFRACCQLMSSHESLRSRSARHHRRFATVGDIRRLWDRLEDFSRRDLHTGNSERMLTTPSRAPPSVKRSLGGSIVRALRPKERRIPHASRFGARSGASQRAPCRSSSCVRFPFNKRSSTPNGRAGSPWPSAQPDCRSDRHRQDSGCSSRLRTHRSSCGRDSALAVACASSRAPREVCGTQLSVSYSWMARRRRGSRTCSRRSRVHAPWSTSRPSARRRNVAALASASSALDESSGRTPIRRTVSASGAAAVPRCERWVP